MGVKHHGTYFIMHLYNIKVIKSSTPDLEIAPGAMLLTNSSLLRSGALPKSVKYGKKYSHNAPGVKILPPVKKSPFSHITPLIRSKL